LSLLNYLSVSLEVQNVSNPTDRLCGQPHQIQRGSGLCVRGHSALGRPQPPPGLLHQGMSPWLASPTCPLPPPDRRRLYLRRPWLNRPLHRPERDDHNAVTRSRYSCSNSWDPTASARASPPSRVVLRQRRQLRGVREPLLNTSSCQRELRSGRKICRGQAGLGEGGAALRRPAAAPLLPTPPPHTVLLHYIRPNSSELGRGGGGGGGDRRM